MRASSVAVRASYTSYDVCLWTPSQDFTYRSAQAKGCGLRELVTNKLMVPRLNRMLCSSLTIISYGRMARVLSIIRFGGSATLAWCLKLGSRDIRRPSCHRDGPVCPRHHGRKDLLVLSILIWRSVVTMDKCERTILSIQFQW
jgi:hypothetical protein